MEKKPPPIEVSLYKAGYKRQKTVPYLDLLVSKQLRYGPLGFQYYSRQLMFSVFLIGYYFPHEHVEVCFLPIQLSVHK